MLERLDDAPGTVDPEPFAGPDHPMRRVTRSVAFENKWSPERAKKIAELFGGMAAEWGNRGTEERRAPITDALARGGVPTDGAWLELGSGTGAGTCQLCEEGINVVALDLASEMLANADPGWGPRILGDSSCLPMPSNSVDAILCVNMLLFPAEVDRVLRPDGVIVWVNSLGDQTPIHLPSEDVLEALPGEWTGRTARAGSGFWLVASRA